MRGAIGWWLVASVVAGLAAVPGARAEELADMLKGKWATEGGDCIRYITLELSGDTLRITDAAGRTDAERVIARRATGIATQVVRSTHGIRVGSRTVYELLAPGQLSLTEAATGRSAGNLSRCPDPLPVDFTPQQVVQTIYDRYATPDAVGTPFDSEVALRQFLAPELADHYIKYLGVTGHVPEGCKGNHDPFVPDANDGLRFDDDQKGAEEVKAGKARVTAQPVPPGATQSTVHVSIGDLGKSGEITVVLDRTTAGWRISDVIPGSGLSFRADMVACAAPRLKASALRPGFRARPMPCPGHHPGRNGWIEDLSHPARKPGKSRTGMRWSALSCRAPQLLPSDL